MKAACEQSSEPVERLINMGMAYYDFADAHPAHFRLMFGGNLERKEKHITLVEIEQKGYAIVEFVVGECMKLPNAPQKPAELVRLTCWSLVHGLSNLLLNDVSNDDIPADANKRTLAREVISLMTKSLFEK